MAHNRPLTAAFVRTVTRPGRYGDGGRGSFGLYLRVWHRPKGRVGESWGQRITINGRRTNLGLGPAAFVTLAQAREKARENASEAYHGRDPRGRRYPTVAEATEKVIALHSKGWKPGTNLPSKWRQTFRDYVLPKIGSKPVGAVTTADVMAVLTPIWTTKPGAAGRDEVVGDSRLPRGQPGRGRDRGGAAEERRPQTPPSGPALRSGGRGADGARQYLPAVRPACRGVSGLDGHPVREVRGATWSEIDGNTWVIPASRMKAKREHRVPLSRAALEVLRDARQLGGGDLVFPGRRTGGPLATNAFGNVLRRLKVSGTVHGFRTSFRTWAGRTRRGPPDR